MLTSKQVAQIKALLAAGNKQKDIGRRFGVTRSTISDIATGRIHKDTSESDRVRELENEIVLLTEERNLAKRNAKLNAREGGLFAAIAKELNQHIQPMVSLPSLYKPGQRNVIKEHCVMHLSDGHHDQVVVPEECGGLENYNFPISCCRAEKYVDTVIDWTQRTLKPQFQFSDLWILAYGDHTSGEIHGHAQRSYFRKQMVNCLAIGKLHALMYRDLAPYFQNVHVVYVPGNHGRRTPKKDHHGAQDNWDFLVAKVAQLHCSEMSNVNFCIPDAYSVNLDINGIGFGVSHGDDVRGALGIPYYGLQRRQKNLLALASHQSGPRVRYICCGHFHKPGSLGDMDGEIMVNGPWVATDSYAYNTFAGFTEPTQWLHGVHEKHGITWRLAANLRQGYDVPKRYKIDV